MEKVDVAIIGSGVVGLACAHALSESGRSILVLEKNDFFGRETSSRNSEVIHAGLYYPLNSLKSKLCISGRKLLYEFCSENNIAYNKLGKIVLGNDDTEVKKVRAIFDNARKCGVENIEWLSGAEISKLEPDVKAQEGFISRETGIIDTHSLMAALYGKARNKGVDFAFGCELTGIKKTSGAYELSVKEPGGENFSFESLVIINAAGLDAARISGLCDADPTAGRYKNYYCKGQYFRIKDPKKYRITHLIYPPPTEVSLGIHITPDLAGGLRLGPDAFYVDNIDYRVNENDRSKFYEDVRKYLPGLTPDELIPDTSGIRPKLSAKETEFNDFVITAEHNSPNSRMIDLLGIESPGFTASLAIGEMVREMVLADSHI